MELKSRFFVLWVKVKVYIRVFLREVGLIRLESHSREYYLTILKELRIALKRENTLIKEMEILRYEIACSGTINPSQLLSLKFDKLIENTKSDFSILDYEIFLIEKTLAENLYAEDIGIRPQFSKYIKFLEMSFNRKIILLNHLRKLTKISLKDLSIIEKWQLQKELKLAIK